MDADARVHGERRRLLSLGYRMTGTLADAEDVVQETYLRWYRLDDAQRADIANPAGWLTTAAGHVALDLLGSARRRREQYVGPWLPEPVPAALFRADAEYAASTTDPLDRVVRDDDVSTALLVVLEAMTPAERVAFVLHDVFAVPFDEIAAAIGRSAAAARQLAASGRRHVRENRVGTVSREDHDRVVHAFQDAAASGSLEALLRVLAPDVELTSDGGGVVSAARRTVAGADGVARMLLGIATKNPQLTMSPEHLADGLGFVFRDGGTVTAVMTVATEGDAVRRVWIVLHPDKLSTWRGAGRDTG